MELKFNHIDKIYGKQKALDDFNVVLTEGVYGLLGPNGAGKTTLINILIGVLNANQGTVYFNNKDINKMGTKYLERIGYLPQYPTFYRNFTTVEFLSYMCSLKGIPRSETKKRIEEVLELVNLTDCTKKRVGALSGGMRQRLGIAQAILNKPKILVLDEPTSGLDPGERIRFRNIISKLSKNRLVLMATHIVSDVEYIAKEILILKEGKLVRKGKTEELEQSVQGKVWKILSDEAQMEYWMSEYLIGNVKREGEKFALRIVSDQPPNEHAEPLKPSLEDVFLATFGKHS